MLLVVDVGNTQTAMGLYEGDTLVQHFRFSSDPFRSSDEYGVLIRQLLRETGVDHSAIHAAVLACVVPSLTEVFQRLFEVWLNIPVLVVGDTAVKTGIINCYDNPAEVGADRIVNAVAGFHRYLQKGGDVKGLIIVDFGTATTFDVVTQKGEYLGGAIAPGIVIATDALFRRASRLPRIAFNMPERVVGKNTVGSMQSGIMLGYVSMVEGMIKRMSEELGFNPTVIATGGHAQKIAQGCKAIHHVNGFLTLDGLRLIYAQNQKG